MVLSLSCRRKRLRIVCFTYHMARFSNHVWATSKSLWEESVATLQCMSIMVPCTVRKTEDWFHESYSKLKITAFTSWRKAGYIYICSRHWHVSDHIIHFLSYNQPVLIPIHHPNIMIIGLVLSLCKCDHQTERCGISLELCMGKFRETRAFGPHGRGNL